MMSGSIPPGGKPPLITNTRGRKRTVPPVSVSESAAAFTAIAQGASSAVAGEAGTRRRSCPRPATRARSSTQCSVWPPQRRCSSPLWRRRRTRSNQGGPCGPAAPAAPAGTCRTCWTCRNLPVRGLPAAPAGPAGPGRRPSHLPRLVGPSGLAAPLCSRRPSAHLSSRPRSSDRRTWLYCPSWAGSTHAVMTPLWTPGLWVVLPGPLAIAETEANETTTAAASSFVDGDLTITSSFPLFSGGG